ncbi:ABC transporter permease [Bosea sp. NBC_00550]|uniref:ABC transporter permease n=1 Tax=Bosea sp. NBC_00550 TaxID=2969621 RepID=UPI0022300169|nr:ABC transporter permease [Bosea sp. NBC_00550]UZF94999.1 ABC transporter permease [Bosea sp. NBC_00550]
MSGRASRLLFGLIACATYLFMVAPLLVIAAASLDGSASAYIRFPPESLSLRWYLAIPQKYWLSLALSFAMALSAAALSTLLGTLAALGIARGSARGNAWLTTYFNLPLQIPFVVTGVVFLQFYNILAEAMGLDLVGRFWGLVIAHLFFCVPYAVGAIGSVITADLDRNENAARIAGATEWRVLRRITVPALKPGLFSGFFFAFIVSFGDVPVSVFLVSGGTAPLPVEIFQTLQFDYDPTVLAISTIVLLLSAGFVVAMRKLTGLDIVMPGSSSRR